MFFKGPDLNHLWQLFLARKNSVAAAQWGASLYYEHYGNRRVSGYWSRAS